MSHPLHTDPRIEEINDRERLQRDVLVALHIPQEGHVIEGENASLVKHVVDRESLLVVGVKACALEFLQTVRTMSNSITSKSWY